MNPLVKKFALLVRDLMAKPESEILIGRLNANQEDFETSYIAIDQLGASVRIAGSDQYDGSEDVEVMSYDSLWRTELTVEFYGVDAYTNADWLAGLLRSQDAFDKKYALGIGVFQVSSIADIKQLTGQQYGNRLQMSVTVQDSRRVDVDTLRIDTVQFTVLTEDGEITP